MISGASAVNTRVHFLPFGAHEAAGALGTRHSPRPPGGRSLAHLGRIASRACWRLGGLSQTNCLKSELFASELFASELLEEALFENQIDPSRAPTLRTKPMVLAGG